MQLRDENNRLAGPQDEVRLVAKHFAEVFDATSACDGFLLKEDFCFTAAEFHDYLLELPLHKALPPHCAPAPLWRLCSEAISEFTVRCLNGCLRAGPFADQWPSEWSVSYLCLLPKTDQALDSVGKMRPISLLHHLENPLPDFLWVEHLAVYAAISSVCLFGGEVHCRCSR